MTSIIILGNYLRDLRLSAGLTLKQVAEILGCTVSYLSNIENAHKMIPKWSSIENIVTALGGNIQEARAYYLVVKLISQTELVDRRELSEQAFAHYFVEMVSQLFHGYEVEVGYEIKDGSGKVWDIALEFKHLVRRKNQENE